MVEALPSTIILALIALTLGLVGRFLTPFIPSYQELSNRANFLRKSSMEKVSLRNAALLRHVIDISQFDNEIRGDGVQNVDLAADFTLQIFDALRVVTGVDFCLNIIRGSYIVLLLLSAAALVLLVSALLFQSNVSLASMGLLLIVLQIVTIIILVLTSFKLESYDKN